MKKNRYWKNVDRPLLGSVLLLMVFGLVAVSSASAVLSYQRYGHNNYYSFRQIIFVVLGLVVIFVMSRIDYHFWKRLTRPIIFAGLLLLAAVLIPGIGLKVGPSRSWLNLGVFLVQPSEFVKLAVIIYLASWFERKKGAEENFWFGLIPPLLICAAALTLLVLEPDIGATAMLALIIFAILFAAGAKLKYLIGLVITGIAGLWMIIKTSPYRAARLLTFLDPSLDPRGIGYHINQALLAIGAGGLWGYGLGDSRQKHNYLPEPIGDSIFAVMAEELGFVRIIFLVLLFGFFAVRGLSLAKRAPDKFGQLVSVGVVSWVVIQAFINIGSITNILPLTGVSLPFISYGGSSLLALSIAIGILLNISKQRTG